MSRSFSIVESMSLESACASSAPIAATTSCATRGSSTFGSAGYGLSAGPLSTNACTTTPARIPIANRESVTAARPSFTADHLAAGHGQRQRKELVNALRVSKVDGIDVDRVAADGRAADVGERERRDRRRGAARFGA